MIKNKLKASSIHLLLSLILVTLIIGSIIYFWYPIEYLSVTNFKDITLLVITIDLVLGPLLTFVVFNPKKKSLRFDLAVIAAFQISALSYGVYALYQTHPLFITYNHSRFNLIHANEVTPEDAKYPEFKISKLASPKIAFAKMPSDPDKQTEIILGVSLKGEPDIDKRTEYYEPHTNHLDTILAESLDHQKIFAENSMSKASRKFLEKYKQVDNYAYLPLKGRSADAIIVLDKKSAKPIATINTNPWTFAKK